MKETNVIALICLSPRPSKRIPNKSFSDLHGKSLAEWAVFNARRSGINDIRIVVEDKIAHKWAKKLGARALVTPEIPNRTNWTSEPVLVQAAAMLEEGFPRQNNVYVNLQATCPFVEKSKLLSAIELVSTGRADSVISVHLDVGLWWIDKDKYIQALGWSPVERPRSQDAWPRLYKESGHFFVFNKYSVMRGARCAGRVKPVVINPDYFVDIDEMKDLERARRWFGTWAKEELGGVYETG